MKTNNIIALIVSIAACELAGIVGSIFTTPEIQPWFSTLVRAPISPPNWVFAPVWTLLYAVMGLSLWLVLTGKKKITPQLKKVALVIFAAQLILNILWSYIFFGQHDLGTAFFELIVLWIAIAATILVFARVSKLAAWLLVPYFLWVTFAGFLNYSLWQLNKAPTLILPPAIETPLPIGYSANNYIVEKTTDNTCTRSGDCMTPFEYSMMSRCPFASVCIEGKCAVVCPKQTK